MADDREPTTIELPAPTAAPMIAALGITLGFAGLVTHWMVSAVGVVLTFAGAIGWFREVLPVEHHEAVPLRPPAERAKPIVPAPQRIATLVPGEASHRVHVPAEMHPYSAGVRGGLVGGAAMAALALLYGLLAEGSLWYPINLLAAIAMPDLATASDAELAAFHPGALVVAVLAHGVSSIFVGLVYAALLPMFPRRTALWGGVVAPLVWTGLLWASLRVINPVLNARIEWIWFIASQIAFGLACGAIVSRSERIPTMQSWPLAARVGVDAPGIAPDKEEER